ncbi:MAG TPA: hypothetical protein VG317_07355 [Pseudonocardiaceae bacterium]|nr:hypothetical protein [Pseudonocardiaceae bacterium]
MYARSTTIQAQVSSIDNGIAHVRDVVMPALLDTDGCLGLSLLVDRMSHRCIATSSWQTEDAMRASETMIASIRDRAAEAFGGSPQVEEWEIAVLHRDHQSGNGACVRATWFQVDPAQLDRAIDVYKMGTMPAIAELDGFCSASLMVNRASGRAVSSVAYDSMDAMRRNRSQAESVRSTAAAEARADLLDVCEFELAVAHLRVPEMA